MKLTLILAAVLLLPPAAEATTRKYARGFTEFWCDDSNCYATAVTNADYTMELHKTRARVVLTSPDGLQTIRETGFVVGAATARVQFSHNKFQRAGTWTAVGDTGQLYCPRNQRPLNVAMAFSRKKKLGVSTICARIDSPSWRISCKPVIDPIFKKQLGWNCGYFPKDPCQVKCVASHYTLYVVSPGGTIIPADSGTFHKGFSIDVDTGEVTCTGFLVSFTPDGIPGILPCKSCKEDIIFGP